MECTTSSSTLRCNSSYFHYVICLCIVECSSHKEGASVKILVYPNYSPNSKKKRLSPSSPVLHILGENMNWTVMSYVHVFTWRMENDVKMVSSFYLIIWTNLHIILYLTLSCYLIYINISHCFEAKHNQWSYIHYIDYIEPSSTIIIST